MAGALPHQKFAPLKEWGVMATQIDTRLRGAWSTLIGEIRTATDDKLLYIDTRPSNVSVSYWEKGIIRAFSFLFFLKKKK